MNTIFVGIGEIAVSNKPDDIIKTMALGSCVAIIVVDKLNKSGGMIHIALPNSSINKRRAIERPGMFADTGIPLLFKMLFKFGKPERKHLLIKLAGGATIMDPNNTFNIGKKNVLAIKKALWANKLGPIAEDIGGTISRTTTLEVRTGKIIVSSPGRGQWEL